MTRYERTGEYRVPKVGEWYDCHGPRRREQTDPDGYAWVLRRVEEPDAKPKPGLCPKCGSDEWVGDLTTAFDFGSQVSCYKCGYFELRDPANEESRVREEERRARWKPTQASRPGTEALVDALDFCWHPHYMSGLECCREEILRRVRAHEKLRSWCEAMYREYPDGSAPHAFIDHVRAILDSEAQ